MDVALDNQHSANLWGSPFLRAIMIPEKYQKRFWQRVDRRSSDECWEWNRGRTKAGYGTLDIMYKKIYSHRLSWMIHFGEIPEHLEVCHKCDNPPCCNPNHLFLGTHKENLQDAVKKNRWASNRNGETLEIIRMAQTGKYSYAEIGRRFNISRQRAHQIVERNRTPD